MVRLLHGPRLYCLLLLLPAFELLRHVQIVAAVPKHDDYRAAAAFVRGELAPNDLIAAAPSFIDPIVRQQLGDRIPLAMAGRSDTAAYERMWVLSIRGALPPDAPPSAAALEREFGGVRVLRFDLGPSPLLFDFVSAWRSGRATLERPGGAVECRLRQGGVPRGGGLGKGVLLPLRERYECDANRAWAGIGPVVMEDLDNRPRYCLLQAPQGEQPVRMTFSDVPLGDELIFDAGLYYEHERMRQGGPVEATIAIDGQTGGTLLHRDGDGWKRLRLATRPKRGTVEIAVRAPHPEGRSFCWSASTRNKPAAGRVGP